MAKSIPAQAAAAIKKFIKAQGIGCKVKSEIYSGGSSVSAWVNDVNPELANKIEKELKRYQYGNFDSMNDIYEFDSVKEDLPQVYYVFLENTPSEEMQERIAKILATQYKSLNGMEFNGKYFGIMIPEIQEPLDRTMYRAFRSVDFWKENNL